MKGQQVGKRTKEKKFFLFNFRDFSDLMELKHKGGQDSCLVIRKDVDSVLK